MSGATHPVARSATVVPRQHWLVQYPSLGPQPARHFWDGDTAPTRAIRMHTRPWILFPVPTPPPPLLTPPSPPKPNVPPVPDALPPLEQPDASSATSAPQRSAMLLDRAEWQLGQCTKTPFRESVHDGSAFVNQVPGTVPGTYRRRTQPHVPRSGGHSLSLQKKAGNVHVVPSPDPDRQALVALRRRPAGPGGWPPHPSSFLP